MTKRQEDKFTKRQSQNQAKDKTTRGQIYKKTKSKSSKGRNDKRTNLQIRTKSKLNNWKTNYNTSRIQTLCGKTIKDSHTHAKDAFPIEQRTIARGLTNVERWGRWRYLSWLAACLLKWWAAGGRRAIFFSANEDCISANHMARILIWRRISLTSRKHLQYVYAHVHVRTMYLKYAPYDWLKYWGMAILVCRKKNRGRRGRRSLACLALNVMAARVVAADFIVLCSQRAVVCVNQNICMLCICNDFLKKYWSSKWTHSL